MPNSNEIEQLYARLAQLERNSTRSSWLLRQLGRKIKYFPRDFSRRMRRSLKKRRMQATQKEAATHQLWNDEARAHDQNEKHAQDTARRPSDRANDFYMSDDMLDLIAKACALDPEIGELDGEEHNLRPPWEDHDYIHLRAVIEAIPNRQYDSVVLMPAGRMGGADLVAAILAQALAQSGKVLILRTDDSHWDCPHWYPDDADSVDVSAHFKDMHNPRRALYAILTQIAAPRVFNVNSQLAFDTMASFGAQLANQFRLYAYYFCADRTKKGYETGYPVWYFHNIFRYLSAAILDTHYLAEILRNRYSIPPAEAIKLKTIYTPARIDCAKTPVAERQSGDSARKHPCILWAGRLDRQKRFDLVIQIARAMSDVNFRCWGKAVLDKRPSMRNLPDNLTLSPPFTDYDELPLTDCDGWLYTAEWDGLPTILIELGALGMPIVASAVGGVPELIDEATGWLVPESASVQKYVDAIRAMISDPEGRASRGRALQQRVQDRHSMQTFVDAINSL